MDIYNKLCPELQVIIQKKYQRILLHDRLKHAQKYLKYFVTPVQPVRHLSSVDRTHGVYFFSTARTHFTVTTFTCVTWERNSLYDLVSVIVKSCDVADPENVVISTQLFNLDGYVEYFRLKFNQPAKCFHRLEINKNKRAIELCINKYIIMLRKRGEPGGSFEIRLFLFSFQLLECGSNPFSRTSEYVGN